MMLRCKAILCGLLFAAGAFSAEGMGAATEAYYAMDYAKAEQGLRQIVQNEPDNNRAKAWLALALIGQSKLGEAEDVLSKLGDEEFSERFSAQGMLQAANENWGEALTAFEKAEELDGKSPLPPFGKGFVEARQKNNAAAVTDLETAIERQPRFAAAYYYAGIAYNGISRRDKMVERFQLFLKLAPKSPEARKVQSLLRAVR